ncbi:sushi domain-containing protein 2 [Lingula anatina]|uniref:Sushi domain-containing protein 2 n=1 Tax=Lingula anatina TaxID=7574 RepID=A0A1S3K975_LINAN|nr:sushi domain-containing protein 2 [Lingula anatina]|eukprot:XP_013419175.1 sushi domain-containing protein 2 [Lingula anatina]
MTASLRCPYCLYLFWILSLIAAVQGSGILYPYGLAEGDATVPVSDDGGTGEIALAAGFPFFDQVHSSLYVNSNGAISFLVSVTQFTPDPFPLDSNRRIIAPFWADIDTSRNTGRVYYRQTTSEAVLNKTDEDVRRAFVVLSNFNATWAFVCTYAGVTFYGGSSTTPTNTFQVVLTTDGRHSFVIFNYLQVTWTTGTASGGDSVNGLGGTPAQAGFNAGDGIRYFSVPGSRTSSIVDIETKSNVLIPGRWVFRVDEATVVAAGCTEAGTLYTSPVRGPALGGTAIELSGPCIQITSNIVCKIGGAVVPGYFISDLKAMCYTPPMFATTSSVKFEVSIDGGTTYSHSAEFIPVVNTSATPDVVRVREDAWTMTGTYVIQWQSASLSSSLIDVDILGFSISDNIVTNHWIRLASGIANSGLVELDSLLNARGEVAVDAVGFGAIRLTPSGSAVGQNLTKPCLWSDVHYMLWLLNAYIATELRNGQASTSTTNVFTKLRDSAVKNGSFLRNTWQDTKDKVKVHYQWVNDELCDHWFEEDSSWTLHSDLPACPVVLQQAVRDRGTFEEDPDCNLDAPGGCYLRPGAVHCVQSNRCSPSGGGQECCYGSDGNLLILADSQYGGGSQDRAHRKGCPEVEGVVPLLSNFWHDELPYQFCCHRSSDKEGKCVDKFAARRPSNDSANYNPPRPVVSIGDPHLITLDGLNYTFNGVGEYTLVQTTHGTFTMQGRAEQIRHVNGSLSSATGWTSVALRGTNETVEVRSVSSVRVDVYVAGLRVDFDTLGDSLTLYGGISLVRNPATQAINVSLDLDNIYVTFSHVAGLLNFMLMLPHSLRTLTRGLLGVWNGNIADDFTTSNGVQIPVTSSLQDIHYNFGETWRTSSSGSLFTYDPGQSHTSYQNPAFVPTFVISLDSVNVTEVTLLCGDHNQCIFDYVTTGSAAIAVATKRIADDYQTAVADTQTVVACGRLGAPDNGQRNLTDTNYLEGVTIEFSCNEGYSLEGSANRTCLSSSQWSGQPVNCIADFILFPVVFILGVSGAGIPVVVLVMIIVRTVKRGGADHTEKNQVQPEPETKEIEVVKTVSEDDMVRKGYQWGSQEF